MNCCKRKSFLLVFMALALLPFQNCANQFGLKEWSNSVSGSATLLSSVKQSQFKILIDVNQLNSDEASQASLLAADGVWAITHNSPSIASEKWPSILSALKADKWVVAEDDPTSTYELSAVSNYAGRPVDGWMNYFESRPNDNSVLTPEEIRAAAAIGGNKIIVHSRSYGVGDPRRDSVDLALKEPGCSGVVFEQIPGNTNDNLKGIDINGGINACLNAGKQCYLLLAPAKGENGSLNYLRDIYNTMKYLEEGTALTNPNFYIVLANYVRGGNVGFLSPEAGESANSVLATQKWLKETRDSGLSALQTDFSIRGYIDGIHESGNQKYVSGWACAAHWSQSIDVHLYAGGDASSGTLIGGYAANLSSEPAVASACESTGSAYRFQIPLTEDVINKYGGSSIHVHGISPFGLGNSLLTQSGSFTVPQAPVISVSSSSGTSATAEVSSSSATSTTTEVSSSSGASSAGAVTGVIDGVYLAGDGYYYVAGWACAKYSEQSLSVHFYIGGPAGSGSLIGGYSASLSSEPAVAAACESTGGAYRFQIPIATSTATQYSGQTIYVHGIHPLNNHMGNELLTNSGVFKIP